MQSSASRLVSLLWPSYAFGMQASPAPGTPSDSDPGIFIPWRGFDMGSFG